MRRGAQSTRARVLHLALLLLLLAAQVSWCQAAREARLYSILGVAPDADAAALKKAYRKAALCVSDP